jgi:hypothetical protein
MIHLTPLRLSIAILAVLQGASLEAMEPGFRPLFNGRDLSGWEGVTSDAAQSWRVDDGAIECTGLKGTWLRSREQYGDFNFRFEYKLKPGGNSGIYLHVPADGAHREGGGVEVQLLDDAAERYKDIKPSQACGCIYLVAPATQRVAQPAGQWNTMEINCQGTSYRVTHNGVLIVDASGSAFPELEKRFVTGYLGLQNHDEEVWFRKLRIGPPQPSIDELAKSHPQCCPRTKRCGLLARRRHR